MNIYQPKRNLSTAIKTAAEESTADFYRMLAEQLLRKAGKGLSQGYKGLKLQVKRHPYRAAGVGGAGLAGLLALINRRSGRITRLAKEVGKGAVWGAKRVPGIVKSTIRGVKSGAKGARNIFVRLRGEKVNPAELRKARLRRILPIAGGAAALGAVGAGSYYLGRHNGRAKRAEDLIEGTGGTTMSLYGDYLMNKLAGNPVEGVGEVEKVVKEVAEATKNVEGAKKVEKAKEGIEKAKEGVEKAQEANSKFWDSMGNFWKKNRNYMLGAGAGLGVGASGYLLGRHSRTTNRHKRAEDLIKRAGLGLGERVSNKLRNALIFLISPAAYFARAGSDFAARRKREREAALLRKRIFGGTLALGGLGGLGAAYAYKNRKKR